MNMIRIGIVGVGFTADFHYKGFKSIEGAEVVGITRAYYGDEASRQRAAERLVQKAAKLGLQVYANFDEMVADPGLDALIITSINPLHHSQILKGIEQGKHLMVEKPVVTSFSDLDEIEHISAQRGIKLFPAHNFAYRGAVRKGKEIIESGALGNMVYGSFMVTHQISSYHANGWRANKELSSGGALMDSGHHLIYQSLYLMGLPARIQAFGSKLYHMNMDCEDTACVNLMYESGAVGTIMQSWASGCDGGVNGLRVIGTKGSIAITDALYHNKVAVDTDVDYANSFRNQAKAFIDYLVNGTEPVSTLQDVRNTLKIVYNAYESADRNTVIEVAP